uniref:GCR123 n=1 Tax=Schmidtea mediterranea TaxID=79327 RepID=A0A193KUN4_SCHMD|nr:GCR123 [Schmidtea mediterranea]
MPFTTLAFGLGVIINVIFFYLLLINRHLSDKTINKSILFNLAITLCDGLICLEFLINLMDKWMFYEGFVGKLMCILFYNDSAFYFLMSCRSGLTLLMCLYHFIKLLYPFLVNSVYFTFVVSSGFVLLLGNSILIPFIIIRRTLIYGYEYELTYCLLEPFNYEGTQFLINIVFFTYSFLMPGIGTVFFYAHILKSINSIETISREKAFVELRKSFLIDSLLFIICYLHFSLKLLSYCFSVSFEKENHLDIRDSSSITIGMYSMSYALFSMIFKSSHRRWIRRQFLIKIALEHISGTVR